MDDENWPRLAGVTPEHPAIPRPRSARSRATRPSPSTILSHSRHKRAIELHEDAPFPKKATMSSSFAELPNSLSARGLVQHQPHLQPEAEPHDEQYFEHDTEEWQIGAHYPVPFVPYPVPYPHFVQYPCLLFYASGYYGQPQAPPLYAPPPPPPPGPPPALQPVPAAPAASQTPQQHHAYPSHMAPPPAWGQPGMPPPPPHWPPHYMPPYSRPPPPHYGHSTPSVPYPGGHGGHQAHPGGAGGGGGQHQRHGPPDSAKVRAININKRITQATAAKEILDIVQYELDGFDTVALATAVHRLGSLRGAPNLHEQITQSPEFFKLMQAIKSRGSEHNVRNIANILWGAAKMNYLPPNDVMEALCAELPGKVEEGVAQNVANTLWALSALSYRPKDKVLAALAAAVRSKIGDFTSQHISNTVLSFAKLEYAIDPEILQALGRAAVDKLPTFTAQALSNTLWGLSKLGIADGELFRTVGEAARANLQNFNAQNLSNTIYAYGNLGINPGSDVLAEFSAVVSHKIPDFTPQNLSNVAWAYAKMGEWDPALFSAMAWKATQTMHTFTPQSIANFLWAYATLGQAPDAVFLRAAVAQSVPVLDQWAPQNLSNAAWSLAALRDENLVKAVMPTFLSAIAREVNRRLANPKLEQEFSRQHLVNYLWALAMVDYNPGENALRAVIEALRTRVQFCIAQELANAVWACSKLKAYNEGFMDAFADEAVRRIDEFTGQNLAMFVHGYARLAHYHADLMVSVAGSIVEQIDDLSDQHLVHLLHSYAVLNVAAPEMFPTVVEELRKRLATSQFPLTYLSDLLWSCAVADVLDRPLWDALIAQVEVCGWERCNDQTPLSMVFQAWMLCLARHPERHWPFEQRLMERAMADWKVGVQDVTVSKFHSEVSRTLNAMNIPHVIEHLTEDELFSIDVGFPDERIAMEVDGPYHFTRNSLRPMAHMFTRTALLEARGWRVVSVPFFAWEGVEEAGRRSYLQNLLVRARAGLDAHPTKLEQGVGQRSHGADIDIIPFPEAPETQEEERKGEGGAIRGERSAAAAGGATGAPRGSGGPSGGAVPPTAVTVGAAAAEVVKEMQGATGR